MRIIDEKNYLSPMEASYMLEVSLKTIQRWAENGSISAWVGTGAHRKLERRQVTIEVHYTPNGSRLYLETDIKRLRDEFAAARLQENKPGP